MQHRETRYQDFRVQLQRKTSEPWQWQSKASRRSDGHCGRAAQDVCCVTIVPFEDPAAVCKPWRLIWWWSLTTWGTRGSTTSAPTWTMAGEHKLHDTALQIQPILLCLHSVCCLGTAAFRPVYPALHYRPKEKFTSTASPGQWALGGTSLI